MAVSCDSFDENTNTSIGRGKGHPSRDLRQSKPALPEVQRQVKAQHGRLPLQLQRGYECQDRTGCAFPLEMFPDACCFGREFFKRYVESKSVSLPIEYPVTGRSKRIHRMLNASSSQMRSTRPSAAATNTRKALSQSPTP